MKRKMFTDSIKDDKMFAFRNFSVCAALLAMVAFSITGCCSGNCGLLGGGAASAPAVSSSGCSTCGGGSSSYSAPSQSYSTQDFSTQQFSTPTSAEVEQSTFLVLEGVDQSTCRQYKVVVKALAVDQFRFHRLVDQAHVNSAWLSESRSRRT